MDGPKVHRIVFGEMLDKALTSLTGQVTISEAWRSFLRADDVVGLKFNRSGQQVIGTTDAVADIVISSLESAGISRSNIVLIEAPAGAAQRNGTLAARTGFATSETDFESGSDHFASVLDQVTALINIPFLKTHNLAGMTCALKNLSHGLVKHPARFHGNGCSPYIGDIVAAAPIRPRLRLSLVDALRVVYDGGPEARMESTEGVGILLASFDPVATDRVGLRVLNGIRRLHNISPIARSAEELPYLAAAHRRGLGIALWDGIHRVRMGL